MQLRTKLLGLPKAGIPDYGDLRAEPVPQGARGEGFPSTSWRLAEVRSLRLNVARNDVDPYHQVEGLGTVARYALRQAAVR